MTDPLFWLVLSLLFVTISLTIVLVVAIPTLRELSRASRSAEKLFDTLRREFPPTLQAIRLTGLEISDLTEDVSDGVQSAGQVVKQVDQSLTGVRQQAQRVQYTTRSVVVGLKAAWRTFVRSSRSTTQRRSDRLPTARSEVEFNGGLYDTDYLDGTQPEAARTHDRRILSQDETLSQPARHPERSRKAGDPHPAERQIDDVQDDDTDLSMLTPRKMERSRSPSGQSSSSTPGADSSARLPEAGDRLD